MTSGEIERLVNDVRSIGDPAERAKRAQEAQREAIEAKKELAAIRTEAVRELRAAGWSHAAVGDLLGLHRNRAQGIAEARGQARESDPE